MSNDTHKRPEPPLCEIPSFGDGVVLVDGIPMRSEDVVQKRSDDVRAHFNFDNGDFGDLNARRLVGAHSAVVQREIVRIGHGAARFELRAGDYVSEGQRAELRDWLNAPLESETWYGLSTFLPNDFPVHEGVGCVLAQWHDQAKLGDPSGKPPIAIRFKDGRLYVTGAQSRVASHAPDQRFEFFSLENYPLGTWSDFVFRVFWSRYGESQIDAWMNGKQIIRYRGKLGYENETVGPYFKFGMYCHGMLSSPHIVYHDNYSRGHNFADVDPSVLHKDRP